MDAWDELLEEPLYFDGIVVRRWSDLHLLADAREQATAPADDPARRMRVIPLPRSRHD